MKSRVYMKLKHNHYKTNIQKSIFYVSMLFVFIFFYRISSLTPLAGDDWGYAVNGIQGHPFKMAFDFYFSWSGRFFSELYGFLIAPNKALWNALNAVLFTSIYYHALKISKMDNSIFANVLLLFLMLSVKDELRMETYTWLMGTTYVIPLALSLFYFNQMIKTLEIGLKMKVLPIVIQSIVLFYIGLTMENIAVVMILANLCFILYSYLKYREIPVYLYHYLFMSLLSLTLLRLSPGASARLLRDHQDWLNYSIIDQIMINFPNFIRFTFIEHRYLVLVFSGLNIVLIFKQIFLKRRISIVEILLIAIFGIASLSSISLTLSQFFQHPFILELSNYRSSFHLFFWPLFILAVFTNMLTLSENNRNITLFFILLAGLANGVMMASPIFGYRSSLYTVYFMIIASLIIFGSLKIKWLNGLLILPLLFLVIRSANGLHEKYKLVESVHEIRMGEITYYKKNPEVKEAWLIRYPIFSIHSGDVEENDLYHMEVFKEYYGLNQAVKLIFYYPEKGYGNLHE